MNNFRLVSCRALRNCLSLLLPLYVCVGGGEGVPTEAIYSDL